MHKIADPTEQKELRKWAKDNYIPILNSEIPIHWHPVTRDECFKLRIEFLLEDGAVEDSFIEALVALKAENAKKIPMFTTDYEPNIKRHQPNYAEDTVVEPEPYPE